jgi:hypothetical protein
VWHVRGTLPEVAPLAVTFAAHGSLRAPSEQSSDEPPFASARGGAARYRGITSLTLAFAQGERAAERSEAAECSNGDRREP